MIGWMKSIFKAKDKNKKWEKKEERLKTDKMKRKSNIKIWNTEWNNSISAEYVFSQSRFLVFSFQAYLFNEKTLQQ